ncbi:MAG: DUF3710 domain-containing protein [Jatrophihabitans sp.]|uniref:DUF3710 domain-containing protein n=1 Tax=Jatrophihabitans sp. TaxID=1932789 RepID=UPI003F7DE706
MARKQKRTDRSKIDATPPWETRVRAEVPPTTGPYDVRDEPDDEVERVDLGALRIPVQPGLDIRLDVNEQQQVVAATVAGPHGTMQIGVFAAPRNEGIWGDVRTEIAESLQQQRGNPKDREDGPFGPELLGNLRDERNQPVPVRFVGVDGPRWFLRAMLVGPVAADDAAAEPFEELLRQVVVVRGTDPLPVREPVPLRLPQGVELPTPGA